MNTGIDILFLLLVGFGLFYSLSSLILLYVRTRPNVKRVPSELPPISIFKPLKGLDDQLEQNLESFFHLDYPKYQLLFGVGDHDDPAIPIVEQLCQKYHHVRTVLVISNSRIGLNPKINNLVNMYPQASHDYLVISDSNVRVRPDYLKSLMAEMEEPHVGLVTSTIRGIGTSSVGSFFENLHLNSFVAGSVFAVRALFGVSIAIGKSMLLHRETLARIGGFERFANYLAEDHSIGVAVQSRGLAVRTSGNAIDSINETWKFGRFVSRHVRWGMMRRHFSLLDYVAEVLSHPIILAALFLIIQMSDLALMTLASALTVQTCCAVLASRVMKSDFPAIFAFAAPVKEATTFGIWLVPFFKNTVEWRGHTFAVSKDTKLHPIDERTGLRILRVPRRTFEATRRFTIKWTDRIAARLAR